MKMLNPVINKEVSVKIQNVKQDKNYNIYFVHLRIMNFEMIKNDFVKVVKDEILLEELLKLKERNENLTGYLTCRDENKYVLYMPIFNLYLNNYLFFTGFGGKQFYLKDGKYYEKK